MVEREGGDWAAWPGVNPAHEAQPATTLDCDGEVFELRPAEHGGTHYTWLTGPNPGYGFTVSPTPDADDEHRIHIRDFLSMIDPATGYIAD